MFALIAIAAFVFVLLMLHSMIVNEVKKFTWYVIYKGKHYSDAFQQRVLLHTRNSLFFKVSFGKGSSYVLDSKGDQGDINKLYGLGWGWPGKNSMRIGWRWNSIDNKIELFAYVHDNEKTWTWFHSLGKVSLGEEFEARIYIDKDRRAVNVMTKRNLSEKNQVVRYVFKKKVWKVKYRLFPYFGGNQVAPDDVRILLKEILV